MKRNTYRTVIIYAVLIFAAIYIYPTIGWLALSSEAREARLAKWKEEDSVYTPPSVIKDTAKAIRRWAEFDASKVVTLGLDLKGGVHMVVGFRMEDLTDEQREMGFTAELIQDQILKIIQRRINEFEAKDPIIQKLGKNQIQIQLPGERDVDRAKNLIKQTAKLTFHMAPGPDETLRTFQAIKNDPQFTDRFTPFLLQPKRGGPFRVPMEYIDQIKDVVAEINNKPGLLPEDKAFFLSQPPNPWDPQEYELYLLEKNAQMSGEGLRMAMARPDDQNPGKFQVLFEFRGAAAEKFGQVTGANVGRNMAIVLDNFVVSAPTIQSKITGNGQITGDFSAEQAQDLAIALRSGSMPVPLYEEYTGVVGPSVGSDSIEKGLRSSILALVAVLLFMLFYYRLGGLVSCVALFLNGLIMLALFAYFRLTLTLPGIAGFVLTLGMAVDANVLIFERVREEVRNGKSLISAIELGYKKATVTIMDSNLTTLIAALVLLQFGTGPVQGFGVALAIGIVTSVFTALVVTQAIFDFFISRKRLSKLPMMNLIPPDTKIPFVELRFRAFWFSSALILLGIVVFFARGYENNWGVDFASGTSMIVKLNTDRPVAIAEVRQSLDAAGFTNSVVQEYGEGGGLAANRFAIRTTEVSESATEAHEAGSGPSTEPVDLRVQKALAPLAGDASSGVTLEKVEAVGPAIGQQLRIDAFKAVFYSLLFMIAYMWFRYNLVFGVAGVLALVHDTIISVGFLCLCGFRIDMNVIAAVLTIIGYSINDTVVVYDRIREDLRMYSGRGLSYGEIMNLAINQTLGRTLLTSLTTWLAAAMLFIFGGEVLRGFAFYLLAGIIIGTYSSIFVASALAYVWQNWRKHHVGVAAPGGRKRPARGSKEAPVES